MFVLLSVCSEGGCAVTVWSLCLYISKWISQFHSNLLLDMAAKFVIIVFAMVISVFASFTDALFSIVTVLTEAVLMGNNMAKSAVKICVFQHHC